MSRVGPKANESSRPPLLSAYFFAISQPAVAKVYVVSFRSHDDRQPSKFIVPADNMKSTIKLAWEHGGADFQYASTNPQDKHRR